MSENIIITLFEFSCGANQIINQRANQSDFFFQDAQKEFKFVKKTPFELFLSRSTYSKKITLICPPFHSFPLTPFSLYVVVTLRIRIYNIFKVY